MIYKGLEKYVAKLRIYNNFITEIKNSGARPQYFFVTNKLSTDDIINNWESYKPSNFINVKDKTVDKIKNDIVVDCEKRALAKIAVFKKRKTLSQYEIKYEINIVDDSLKRLLRRINTEFDWIDFCNRITFVYHEVTLESIKQSLLQQISEIESSLPQELILARMIQEVIDKSSQESPEDRMLNLESFNQILRDNEIQANQKLKMSNSTVLIDILDELVMPVLFQIKNCNERIEQKLNGMATEENQQEIIRRLEQIIDSKNLKYSPVIEQSSGEPLTSTETEIKPEGINCDRLYQIVNEKIQELIENGKYSKAQQIIKELLDSQECPIYPEKFLLDLKIKLGIIYVNIGDISGSKEILLEIKDTDSKFKNKFEYFTTMACLLEDTFLLEEAITGLTELGETNTEKVLWRTRFSIATRDYESVIRNLIVDGSLKTEYEDNTKALEYLGFAYLQVGNYDQALTYLNKANKIKYSWYREFYIILCEFEPIIYRIGSLYLLSKEEGDFLTKGYDRLRPLQIYFEELKQEEVVKYWSFRMSLLLYVDVNLIESEYCLAPKLVQNNISIKLIVADSLSIRNIGSSCEEYEKIYKEDENPEILIKIISSLMVKKKYQDVIQLLKDLHFDKFDKDGRVIGLYLECIKNEYGVDEALKKYEDVLPQFISAPFIYKAIASMYFFESGAMEKTNKTLTLMKQTIATSNYPPRLVMAEDCERLGFINLAIEVIKPLSNYSSKARKLLIYFLIKQDTAESKLEANKILDDLITSDSTDFELIEMKSQLEFANNNPEQAYKLLRKSFELKKTVPVGYNILVAKMQMHNLDDIEDVLNYLCATKSPEILMMVALVYKIQGKPDLMEFYSYKALSLLGNKFDEAIFSKYLGFNLITHREGEEEHIESERISANKAVRLVSIATGKEIWVCLDSEKELFYKKEKLSFVGCEHFHSESEIGILLRNKKRGSLINVFGDQYRVEEIIIRKAKSIRHCLELFSRLSPDSHFLRTVEFANDDPIAPLIPILAKIKEREKFLLRQYNFENGIGLPIYTVGDGHYTKYADAMFRLLELKNQIFYAGENNINPINQTIVLTLSSLVLLRNFKYLEKLKTLANKILVPQSLVDVIELIFNDSEEFALRTTGTMGLDDNGIPRFAEATETQKQNRLEFWRDILLFVKDTSITIVQDIEANDLSHELINTSKNITGECDIDCVLLSRQINAVLICDDLFVRKIANTFNQDTMSANFISLLPLLGLDLNVLLESLLSLSKCEYHCLLSKELIEYLAIQLGARPIIYGEGTYLNKCKKIFSNVFNNPIIFRDNLKIILDILNKLYSNRYKPSYEELITIIISEFKKAGGNYGLPYQYLLDSVLIGTSKLDISKKPFFRKIFNS